MTDILVTIPVTPAHKERLEAIAPGCRFTYTDIPGASEELIAGADIILGCVNADRIHASPRLRLLQLNSAGADLYVKKGILAPGTVLTNATGAYSKSVAEHGFASMLMLQKNLHLYRDAQLRREWIDVPTVTSPADAVIAVIGLGDIGCHFAKMSKALGAYVIGVKRRASDCPEYVDELYTTEELDRVLPRADVVFSVLPGTPATTHIFTAERFKAMKDSAIFINCGRGSAVELGVLYEALRNRDIAAAAVDVFEVEPLPAEHPLWGLDNLMLTPHAAGFFHLKDTLELIVDIAAENLDVCLNGGKYRNVVDFETGYKK